VAYWVFNALYYNSSAGLLTSLLFTIIVIGCGIGLYFAVFAYGAGRFLKTETPPALQAVAIACLWTVMEYCRAHFFTGIPWALLGHSQYPWLSMIQISDITGVYGISWLIVLTNISLFLVITNSADRKNAMTVLLIPVILISASLIYGNIRVSYFNSPDVGAHITNKSNEKSIAVVQISVSQKEKWDADKWQNILSTLLQLSENALKKGAGLVVWPETTVPFYLEQQIPDSIIHLFKKYHATLLTGGPRYTGTPEDYTFYNSVYQIEDGNIVNIYNKIKLLPFGEYFPLGFIDVLKLRYAAPRQYTCGLEPLIFSDPVGKFGALICFEVLFPKLTRDLVSRGADFIVNLSNDAWFGRTSEHYQHFSMAVFRAVECRRPLIRSSNTGISGFIDATGKICNEIQPFKQGYRIYHPTFTREYTFYCNYGDVFAKLCILILLTVCVLQGIKALQSGPKSKQSAAAPSNNHLSS